MDKGFYSKKNVDELLASKDKCILSVPLNNKKRFLLPLGSIRKPLYNFREIRLKGPALAAEVERMLASLVHINGDRLPAPDQFFD